MNGILALKVNQQDNVATVFNSEVFKGVVVSVADQSGNLTEIAVNSDVSYGHKIAICNIKKGENIIKYGHVIGAATTNIYKGDYVHIHNLESLRGRGDLVEK